MNTANTNKTRKARTADTTVNFISKAASADIASKTKGKKMGHVLSVNAQECAQTLKDAACYAMKDSFSNETMNHVLLTIVPKTRKLAVIACDGLGYYERRLNLLPTQNKPSLPGTKDILCISLKDVATLVKFIPARDNSPLVIEVASMSTNDCYSVRISLQNGASTTFLSKANLAIPDYGSIKANAEKGKKKAQSFDHLLMPVREIARAGKVFQGKADFAEVFTTNGISKGVMALLECKNETTDISVIFMLNPAIESAE